MNKCFWKVLTKMLWMRKGFRFFAFYSSLPSDGITKKRQRADISFKVVAEDSIIKTFFWQPVNLLHRACIKNSSKPCQIKKRKFISSCRLFLVLFTAVLICRYVVSNIIHIWEHKQNLPTLLSNRAAILGYIYLGTIFILRKGILAFF